MATATQYFNACMTRTRGPNSPLKIIKCQQSTAYMMAHSPHAAPSGGRLAEQMRGMGEYFSGVGDDAGGQTFTVAATNVCSPECMALVKPERAKLWFGGLAIGALVGVVGSHLLRR